MSDLYVHPSRYDAYGPSYIPLSMGVSVIGSNKAGVIIDRIINGHNGFILPLMMLINYQKKSNILF